MKKECIYCGSIEDLSKSDIFPDALTNAKITNTNVCRIDHNNKFSDMFEGEVIKKLAFITNKFNIKSSKAKKYPLYKVQNIIGGIKYETKISSESELFSKGKKMISTDGQFLIGPEKEIEKIKTENDPYIGKFNVDEIEIEKSVNIEIAVFFSSAMYRLVAKIAFEWYCKKNKVNSKIDGFIPIINFITKNKGEKIVSIVSNQEIYELFNDTVNFGSHTLVAYIAKDNSINIIINLFGIAIYNVRICDSLLEECKNNVLFEELTLDGRHSNFEDTNIKDFEKNFNNSFEINMEDVYKGKLTMKPKDMKDYTIKYKNIYITNYKLFSDKLNLIREPNQKIKKLIMNNIQKSLKNFLITIRSLKRFVKDHQKNFEEGIRLNPKGINKESIFMFYILFSIGKADGEIKKICDLNEFLNKKFLSQKIEINDVLAKELREEMLIINSYPELIIKGAKEIECWEY